MIHFRSFLLFLFFLSFHFQAEAQITLSGKVADKQTGEPLVGASVFLADQPEGTISGSEGRYQWVLNDLPPGTYVLECTFIGYRSFRQTFSFEEPGSTLDISFNLEEERIALSQVEVRAISGGYANPNIEESPPFTFTTLQKGDLEVRNLGQDVPFLLRFTPSAVVNSDAGTGIGYTGIRIRGSDGTRTNVTINGVPLNDAESQGTFWVDLPDFATSVEDLQIQRGVGLSTNGAGAFGAGVHLRTISRKIEPFAQSASSFGSFNTLKNNLSFGTGLLEKGITVEGRLSRISSDGYIDRGSADLNSYFLQAGWWGKKSNLQALLFHGHEVTYQAWFGVPVQYADDIDRRTYNPAGLRSDGSSHPGQVDDYQQTHYQLHYRHTLSGAWSAHLGLHYTRGLGFFEEYKDKSLEAAVFSPEATFAFYGLDNLIVGGDTLLESNLIRRRWLDNHFLGTVWSFDYEGSRVLLTIGGAASLYRGGHFGEVTWMEFASSSEQGERYYDVDAHKKDLNVYTRAQYDLGAGWQAFADLQLRRVGYTWEPLSGVGENVETYLFFNPKAGLSYRWKPGVRTYLSAAIANREPGRFDFLDADPGKKPNPENLFNVEAGYEKQGQKGGFLLNGFLMYYRNQLALTGEINQDALPVRVNIPESYRLGVELSGNQKLGEKWQIDVAVALSENKIQAFTEFIDNWDSGIQETVIHQHTRLAFSPAVVSHASLRHFLLQQEKQSLELGIVGKYVSRQYLDNTSRKIASLDPYFFNDFQVQYTIKPSFVNSISINLLVRNVFNVLYSPNGWIYRYRSAYDARSVDPYAQLETGNTYHLMGLFPQATRNFLIGVRVK